MSYISAVLWKSKLLEAFHKIDNEKYYCTQININIHHFFLITEKISISKYLSLFLSITPNNKIKTYYIIDMFDNYFRDFIYSYI